MICLHLVQAFLCALLSLLRNIRVIDGSLQAARNVVGVLVLIGVGLDISSVIFIVKDFARMLLGFFRGVCHNQYQRQQYIVAATARKLLRRHTGVVNVSFVAADNVSGSHIVNGEVLVEVDES